MFNVKESGWAARYVAGTITIQFEIEQRAGETGVPIVPVPVVPNVRGIQNVLNDLNFLNELNGRLYYVETAQ